MFEWCLLYAHGSHTESIYSWENHQSEEMISASNPLPVHRIPLKHAFQLDNILNSLSSKIVLFSCFRWVSAVSRLMFSVLIYTSALIKTQQKHCSTSCSPPCVHYISRIFYYMLQSPAICVCVCVLHFTSSLWSSHTYAVITFCIQNCSLSAVVFSFSLFITDYSSSQIEPSETVHGNKRYCWHLSLPYSCSLK